MKEKVKSGGIDEESRCNKEEKVRKRRQKGKINIVVKSGWNQSRVKTA